MVVICINFPAKSSSILPGYEEVPVEQVYDNAHARNNKNLISCINKRDVLIIYIRNTAFPTGGKMSGQFSVNF